MHGCKHVSVTLKVLRVCSMQIKDTQPFKCSLDNVARNMRDIPPKIEKVRYDHQIFT